MQIAFSADGSNDKEMHMIAQILEAAMLICFGLSWPLNAYKGYKARTAAGTSWQFIALITIGYLAGIAAKFAAGQLNWVLAVYFLNLAFLAVNWWVYFRNVSLDRARVEERADAECADERAKGKLSCVIVASDGSKASLQAAEFAAGVLRQPRPERMVALSIAPDSSEAAQRHAGEAIERTVKVLEDQGAICEASVLQGSPAAAIVEAASKEHADLVVVGSRGLSGIGALVLGSVSREVVESTGCPVLVVK